MIVVHPIDMPSFRKLSLLITFVVMASLQILAGCGGSGSGTEAVSGSDAAVSVFFTDDGSADFDQAWVTAYRVELANDSSTLTLFESEEGQEIDLRSLTSPEGSEFLFLAASTIPKGTYTKVLVTLAKSTRLFTKGSETSTQAEFPADPSNAERTKLEIKLDPPLAITGATHDLVLDFDLSAWKLEGTSVTPLIKTHSGAGLDDLNRHRRQEYLGVLSGLTGTAPEQTFALGMRGRRLQVVCSADTQILAEALEGDAPLLSEGKLVEVKGVFDILTRTLRAQSVLIKSKSAPEKEVIVTGSTKESNESEGFLSITSRRVKGFIPASRSVKVTVLDSSKFVDSKGKATTKADFFASLKDTKLLVEAIGAWSAETSTFAATQVRLITESAPRPEVSIEGTIKTANKEEGIFVLLGEGVTLKGFTAAEGADLKISASQSTVYKEAKGTTLTRDAFFTRALAGIKIKGTGWQKEGTLEARLLELVETQAPAVSSVKGTP